MDQATLKTQKSFIRKAGFLFLGALLLELIGAGQLHAQQLYYNGNMQFATGSYFFDESTQSFYLTNGLALSHTSYSMSLNIPFVVQNSPWISYSGTGGIPTGGPQHGAVRQQGSEGPGSGQGMGGRRHNVVLPDTASYRQYGFSDPIASASYRVYNPPGGKTSVQFNASVKFPVADPDRGFGTGTWDAGLGGSVSQRLNSWLLTGNVMYWHFGDMPDLELKNSWSYGAGLGRSFAGGSWLVLGSFNGMTELIEGMDPPITAGVGVGYQVSPRVNLNASTYMGLTESSSNVAFGTGCQLRLN